MIIERSTLSTRLCSEHSLRHFTLIEDTTALRLYLFTAKTVPQYRSKFFFEYFAMAFHGVSH